MDQTRTLARAVGGRMREIRDAYGWTQEEVASVARSCGLSWKRATVAAIETGGREISAEELLLIPVMFSFLGVTEVAGGTGDPATFELKDFIPDQGEILLTDAQHALVVEAVRNIVSGRLAEEIKETFSHWGTNPLLEPADIDERAAVRLGVNTNVVATVSWDLWGHFLIVERDQRVAERGTDIPMESRRAIRGRVTRQLIEELRAELDRRGG